MSTTPPPSVRAALLGLLQGPAELLPISSSAHLRIAPLLAGWDGEPDPELQKAFEVAVHAGTAGALLIGQRQLIASELRELDAGRILFLAASFAPPAIAGLAFERVIEKRLGGPRGMAAGLAAGGLAMLIADRSEQSRGARERTPLDGLALGLGQAAALAPGVSRNGATLVAARSRGFRRVDANLLSRIVALPVIAGASLLKGARLRRRGISGRYRRVLAIGTLASFGSTLASQGLIQQVERNRALGPYALYRVVLAIVVVARDRSGGGGRGGRLESKS